MQTQRQLFDQNPRPAPRRRQQNPLTAGLVLGTLGGLAVITGGVILGKKLLADAEEKKPKPEPKLSPLSGVYAQGATLGAMSDKTLLASIKAPIAISMYDLSTGDAINAPTTVDFPFMTRAETLVVRSAEGDMIPLEYLMILGDGGYAFKVDEEALAAGGGSAPESLFKETTAQGQLGRLVTDLTGAAATEAYKAAYTRVSVNNDAFDEPSGTRDAYVRAVLQKLAPGVDWSESPESLAVGTAAWETWMGIDLIGQIAYQNYWASKA